MVSATWQKLHDGQTYKVYRRDGWLFRYTVVDPSGWVITVCMTRWGARRAIEKDKRPEAKPSRGFWEGPIVEESPR